MGACVFLGFATLGSQCLLLREFFSVLSGSELAFGFALAAWTVLSALGALLARGRVIDHGRSAEPLTVGRALSSPRVEPVGRGGALRPPRGVSRWGMIVYSLLAGAVLLAVRAWGAEEVIPFHAYALIAVYLAPLCLLGGMLFPWFLADTRAASIGQAYGLEVLGGLAAGLVSAVLFHRGALACPMALGLVLLAVAWALAGIASGWRAWTLIATGLVVGTLALIPAGQWLECRSLRLRLRDGRVVAALNTPYASLVAARDAEGTPMVFENGVPWPLPDPTPGRAAVAACLRALPERCERALFVHALRQGFGAVLREAPCPAAMRFLETDLRAQAFVRRQLAPVAPSPDIQAIAFSFAALGPPDPGGWDLVAVFGSAPAGLLANLPLTTEFARRVRGGLAPEGVLVIALPAAPGFTHPAQAAYISTVRRSLADTFPATCELRTQLGWTLLAASGAPIDRRAAVERLHARAGLAAPDALAEAEAVLRERGRISIAAIAAGSIRAGGEPDGMGAPPNRIGSPGAYFRYLEFHGALIEDAPRWWRVLFRQRGGLASALVVGAILAAGTVRRRAWPLQGVFWAAWSATVTLILAVYLYQSLTGQAFWAVSLLSAASMLGILAGTGLRRSSQADWAAAGVAAVPALLFPLYPGLERAWPWAVLAALLALVALAGTGLGYAFARRGDQAAYGALGGRLFAVDLLGAGAGLVLGGVLLPWWCGFAVATAIGAGAAVLGGTLAALAGSRAGPPGG